MEGIIREINLHLDNPFELSKKALELAGYLYYHNTKMAQAELKEKEIVLNAFLEASKQGLKRSVAEIEVVGVVQTNNEYGLLKVQAEAIVEMINSIKKRIEVLSWERRSTK